MDASTQTTEGRSALEDVLGPWLNGEHQQQLAEMQEREREQYNGMVGRELMFEINLQRRDRIINMLLHTVLKATINGTTPEVLERIHLIRHAVDHLRDAALDNRMYDTQIVPTAQVEDAVIDELAQESIAGMTTDEETDDEVIDLTADSDEEME